jgi:hypothetical protein
MVVELTAKQRRELAHLVTRATESAQVIRRAHLVLWSADGVAGADIARRLHLSAEAVSRIRRRNQVEGFFGILGKQSLSVTDFPSTQALRDHLNAYMRAWKKNPTPFAWTKPAEAIIRSHRRMLERISTAVQ